MESINQCGRDVQPRVDSHTYWLEFPLVQPGEVRCGLRVSAVLLLRNQSSS